MLPLSSRADLGGQVAALARHTRIPPRELLGLTVEEYQAAQFHSDGAAYSLVDEVLAHLTEMVLAEQRAHEAQHGRQPVARKRPAWKRQRTNPDG